MPEIRVESDGGRAETVEGGSRVGVGGGRDVAALGVEDDRDAGRDGGDDVAQCGPALGTVKLEEGGVGLIGDGEVRGGLDQAEAEVACGSSGGRGEVGRVRVEADAEQ